ncbi:MAG: hypothetical protein QOK28_2917 [Actinomycetota bacterium]
MLYSGRLASVAELPHSAEYCKREWLFAVVGFNRLEPLFVLLATRGDLLVAPDASSFHRFNKQIPHCGLRFCAESTDLKNPGRE